MIRLQLVISIILSSIFGFFGTKTSVIIENNIDNKECAKNDENMVQIFNGYNLFLSNGIIYKKDDKYTYIISTYKNISKNKNYTIIYNNEKITNVVMLGYDEYNDISVFRTDSTINIKDICLANSDFLHIGQINYLYGYKENNKLLYMQSYVSRIDDLHEKKDYVFVYKNVLDTTISEDISGIGVFDSLGRLTGIVNGAYNDISNLKLMTSVNKIEKIVNSIVKNGNYTPNYIKYSMLDVLSLNKEERQKYDVSNKAKSGVLITSLKPFRYIFGGLNQGMVITQVNGVDVESCAQLDKELSRYDKGSYVSLKVIKKNGKTAVYKEKI